MRFHWRCSTQAPSGRMTAQPWTWVYYKSFFELEGDAGDCTTGLFYAPRLVWPSESEWRRSRG